MLNPTQMPSLAGPTSMPAPAPVASPVGAPAQHEAGFLGGGMGGSNRMMPHYGASFGMRQPEGTAMRPENPEMGV